MMKKTIKRISVRSVVVSIIVMWAIGCYQPKISIENIPSDMPVDIRENIKGMYSWNPLKRRSAVIQLKQMGAQAGPAIPFLIGILDDSIWLRWLGLTRTNEEAAKALVKIGGPAVRPLISSLKGDNWKIRVRAALALGEIKDSRAVEPLLDIIHDKEHLVRAAAVIALAKINGPGVIQPLIAALKDEIVFVRTAVTQALGKLKDPRAAQPLLAALKDDDIDVQKSAVKALKELKDPGTVGPLIKALKSESATMRRRAAVALGGIKDPRAIWPLIIALEDEKLLVRIKSAYALYEITGTDLGRSPEKWQKWWAKNKPELKLNDP